MTWEIFSSQVKSRVKTRMHSSRMRTVRLLTVSRSTWEWVVCMGGCLPIGCLVRGCLPREGCVAGGCVIAQKNAGIHPSPLLTEFLTHTCKNITFPAVTRRHFSRMLTTRLLTVQVTYLTSLTMFGGVERVARWRAVMMINIIHKYQIYW